MKQKIKYGYDPTKEGLYICKTKIEYSQPCDDVSNNEQVLEIETEDNGGGAYFVLKTERWAIENIQELIDILNDFKKRAGI